MERHFLFLDRRFSSADSHKDFLVVRQTTHQEFFLVTKATKLSAAIKVFFNMSGELIPSAAQITLFIVNC